MKKLFVMIAAFLFAITAANAQTFAEWFNQKSTQRKYLLQQIAALQVYISYAKKGYDIANRGINTIRNIKNGDFNLHRDFFNSLNQVNTKIKKYAKVADIIAYQIRIIKQAKQTLQNIRGAGQFTADELGYCKAVFDNLLNECIKSIDELFMVITSGELEMKDDERIKRIDKLYIDMQDKYSFCSSFSNEMGVLSMHRMSEQIEINQSKIINGIK